MQIQRNKDHSKGKQVPFLQEKLETAQSELKEFEEKIDATAGKQQERLEILEKIAKAKLEISELTKAIEYSKNTEYFRHPNIPRSIPDEHIWNDAWYDESKKSWVTLNDYFYQLPNAKTRDIQIKYQTENIANPGIIIEEERIEFRNGLPSILREDTKGRPIWYSYATLHDVMLTSDIVKGKFNPEIEEKAFYYTTGSEAWINVLEGYLTEQEYLFACEFMPGLVKMPLNVLRANTGRQHNPKEYKKTMKEWGKENK